jgi:hypothetical protein
MPDKGAAVRGVFVPARRGRYREHMLVGAAVSLVFLLWIGYGVHRSPRFPGSLEGAILGILAALLMLVPPGYTLFRRFPRAVPASTRARWLPRLLEWHVYATLAGTALAILHSGHRFESALGIALMTAMLVAVASGFLGRHFLRFVSDEMRAQQTVLDGLRAEFDGLVSAGVAAPELGAAIADVEYAIAAEHAIKRQLSIWLAVHIVSSTVFYVLLVLHIAASLQFGLRWLS